MISHSFSNRSPEEISKTLQEDYRILDDVDPNLTEGNIVCWDLYNGDQYFPNIKLIKLPFILCWCQFIPLLSDIIKALWLLHSAKSKDCVLTNGGPRLGIFSCILNSFLFRRRKKVVLFDAFMPDNMSWGKRHRPWIMTLRKWAARRMILGATLTVVFSRQQISLQSDFLSLPTTKFVFIPYKANHSKNPPINIKIDNYIFSGGNSRRDYYTLFEAVRGTDIPVIVSSTDPAVYAHLDVPENVMLLAAREPAFARLMAASRFAVLTLRGQLIRSAAEASICNAMWHGRPVICADDSTADEYIQEGLTGYITPPGDIETLRDRILTLWNQPEKSEEMGRAAYQSVAESFTDHHFQQRLSGLGAIVTAME